MGGGGGKLVKCLVASAVKRGGTEVPGGGGEEGYLKLLCHFFVVGMRAGRQITPLGKPRPPQDTPLPCCQFLVIFSQAG